MLRYILFALFSIGPICLFSQTTTVTATFDNDQIGQQPLTATGSSVAPSGLFGEETDFSVQPVTGTIGNSTASGQALEVDVAAAGGFRLVDFDGQSLSGIVSSGVVRVSFDFYTAAGADGFAFLRNYDNAEGNSESFADMGFAFGENNYSIGPLDYDPTTGEFFGWPQAFDFFYNTWYHLEVTIDLDVNTIRIAVDGVDLGLEGGISRATGDGYRGSFLNWGTAFEGQSRVDNFSVEVPANSGLPAAPAGFMDLLTELPDCGGQTIRPPGGDFRTAGLDWQTSGAAQLVYEPVYEGISTYRLQTNEDLDEADARLFAGSTFPLKPNHEYQVSALIRTDFPRATWEISVGIEGAGPDGERSLGLRYGGMPSQTQGPDGWERWTWSFVPHWDARYPNAGVALTFHEYGPGFDGDVNFEIADLAFVECAAEPLVPFPPGEGVTFSGGAGSLPMFVEATTNVGGVIEVTSTSATYRFDQANGTLEVYQRIDHPRLLTRLTNLPLTGLSPVSQNDDVAVLVGNDLTVGVQCDGNVVISPHSPMQPQLESVIGGDFNRLEASDLVCRDDFGGFTASIHSPRGSGRRPQIEPLDAGLPFIGLSPEDLISFAAAAPGWKADLPVLPGERLFVSASPSRPYDWEKSFNFEWALGDWNNDLDYYATPAYMTNWILWNFNQRGWAMSQGTDYVLRDNINAQDHFDAVTNVGDKWGAYFSQWFYYSRNPEEWVGAIQDWKDAYGMETMYSDGMAQDDWLSAYQAMRLLREEVFPEGDIIIHDSYPQSGVPAASYKPAIYSYATGTYMGENAIVPVGEDWAWARYGMSMFRGGNAFGVIKGDGWSLGDSVDKYLVGLVWGGRGRADVANYDSRYRTILLQLETLWETYGDDPYFFDRYYHPDAQVLTGYDIGRAGMPIFAVDTLTNGDFTLEIISRTPGASIYYTTDGSDPTEADTEYTGVIPVVGSMSLRARAFRNDLDESVIAEIDLNGATLPVAWAETKASWSGNCQQVNVSWETSAEESVRYFQLERLSAQGNWALVGDPIFPENGVYHQKDHSATSARPFYRIKQTDVDGLVNYSVVFQPAASDCQGKAELTVAPNPVGFELLLRSSVSGDGPFRVFNSAGKEVLAGNMTGTLTRLPVGHLPSGVYHLVADGQAIKFIR